MVTFKQLYHWVQSLMSVTGGVIMHPVSQSFLEWPVISLQFQQVVLVSRIFSVLLGMFATIAVTALHPKQLKQL